MNHVSERTKVLPVSIAAGASQSNEIDIEGLSMLAIEMPAQWTTTAITFLAASSPGGTFAPVYDDGGTEVSITSANAVAGRMIPLAAIAAKLAPFRYIKLRSGVADTPVNQVSARALKVLGKV